MFDIGFPELLLVSVVLLLVVGPERLPEVLRTVGRFVGGARRSFDALRSELEREVGADEIRRELHNARIMEQAKELDSMVRAGRDEVEELLGERYAALQDPAAIEEADDGDAGSPLSPVPDAGTSESSAEVPPTPHAAPEDADAAEAEGERDAERRP